MRASAMRLLASATAALLLATTFVTLSPPPAEAVSASEFDPGYIISDQKFFDSNTMTEAQIQSFLNSKVSSCVAGYTCLKDYRMTTFTRAAVEPGHCTEYVGETNELASRIIYKTAKACGINPQALLVLLQKETSIVTSTSPSAGTYRKAAGYGCPDTSVCDSAFYGFYNQVYKAAWQFRQYSNYPDRAYRIGAISIGWHPSAACGSGIVNVRNQATANLYNYTPYQPNAAALANLRGTGDGCSAYGNRNFWVFFNDWFGSPTGPVDPMAYLDSAQLVTTVDRASIDLSGWVVDRADRSKSVEVHVYVDQPNGKTSGLALTANRSRPDVGAAYPGAGDLHGFATSIPITQPGTYRACVFPITSAGGWLLACKEFTAKPAAPTGTLDAVVVQQSGTTANISISGWALDQNSLGSASEAHVYLDRPNGTTAGTAVAAIGDRPDIARTFPGAGAAHGFNLSLPITAQGTYTACVYAVSKSAFGQVAQGLGCRSVEAMPSAPLGSLDSVKLVTASDGSAAIAVGGWAFDRAVPASQIPVHLYVDRPNGTVAGIPVVAKEPRSDIARIFPEAGSPHGFVATIPVEAAGTYRVCAYAIGGSVFGAGNAMLGCKDVSTKVAPTFGALDSVTVTGVGADRKVVVNGWAADPAAPESSIPVHVYVDRPNGTSSGLAVTSDGLRADVGRTFPGYGPNHGFSAATAATEPGRYNVCAFAISVSRFGANTLLGCSAITVAQ
jgi:hypothetical protein